MHSFKGHGGHWVLRRAIEGRFCEQRLDKWAEDCRGGNFSQTTGSEEKRRQWLEWVPPRLEKTLKHVHRPAGRETRIPKGVRTWLQKQRAALGTTGAFISDRRRATSWGRGC